VPLGASLNADFSGQSAFAAARSRLVERREFLRGAGRTVTAAVAFAATAADTFSGPDSGGGEADERVLGRLEQLQSGVEGVRSDIEQLGEHLDESLAPSLAADDTE
jgi:hypothetical protein